MHEHEERETRLSLRVSPDQKALIERGADARGLSVTHFVLTVAAREAEQAIAEKTFFALDDETYNHFAAILERPGRVIPAVAERAAKARSSKWKVVP